MSYKKYEVFDVVTVLGSNCFEMNSFAFPLFSPAYFVLLLTFRPEPQQENLPL